MMGSNSNLFRSSLVLLYLLHSIITILIVDLKVYRILVGNCHPGEKFERDGQCRHWWEFGISRQHMSYKLTQRS